MTDIAKALTELGVKEWRLSGEPTTKVEFASAYVKVIGVNDNGLAIESTKSSTSILTHVSICKNTPISNLT